MDESKYYVHKRTTVTLIFYICYGSITGCMYLFAQSIYPDSIWF